MNTISSEPLALIKAERLSLSPSSDQLCYYDTEPYMQRVRRTPGQSPYIPQLSARTDSTDSSLEDYFQQNFPSNFDSSLSSPEEIFDEFIVWDSIQEPSNDPSFPESSDPWTLLVSPNPFIPTGESTKPTASVSPSRSKASRQRPAHLGKTLDASFVSSLTSPSIHSGSQSPIDVTHKRSTKRGPSPVRSAPKKAKRTKSAAHNDVEKRYRTNLNSKIVELSAAIPNLRSSTMSENASGDEMEVESRPEYPCRGGLKKATILSRATAYIKLLEGELVELQTEQAGLKKRLALCGRVAVGEESKDGCL